MIFPFKITNKNPNTNTNTEITKKEERKNISLRNRNGNDCHAYLKPPLKLIFRPPITANNNLPLKICVLLFFFFRSTIFTIFLQQILVVKLLLVSI